MRCEFKTVNTSRSATEVRAAADGSPEKKPPGLVITPELDAALPIVKTTFPLVAPRVEESTVNVSP